MPYCWDGQCGLNLLRPGLETVGTTLTPYLEAILGYLSVSIFTTLTLPFISSAIPCSKHCVLYASLSSMSRAAGDKRKLDNLAAL